MKITCSRCRGEYLDGEREKHYASGDCSLRLVTQLYDYRNLCVQLLQPRSVVLQEGVVITVAASDADRVRLSIIDRKCKE